jgi:exosome complex exonuclease RRP6
MSCLIQVSTHSKDYIIDPFDIWADLTLFNEITADPKIVKVGRQIGMIQRE